MKIAISHCQKCHREIYPTREICPACNGSLSVKEISPVGIILSWTKIFVPPEGFGPEPYKIVLVNIDGSSAALLCNTQIPEVNVGDHVVLDIRNEDWTIVEVK